VASSKDQKLSAVDSQAIEFCSQGEEDRKSADKGIQYSNVSPYIRIIIIEGYLNIVIATNEYLSGLYSSHGTYLVRRRHILEART
jgi:hypothetical protein